MTPAFHPSLNHSPSVLEDNIRTIGESIFNQAQHHQGDFFYELLMKLATQDATVKTQLFRFVDVLPTLTDGSQKKQHLMAYIHPQKPNWPWQLRWLSHLLPLPILGNIAMAVASTQIRAMAHRFIVGDNLAIAMPKLLKSRREGLAFTIDILGETVLSKPDSDYYFNTYHDLIHQLGKAAQSWAFHPLLDATPLGPIPPVNISIKISALDHQVDPMAYSASLQRLVERLTPLLQLATRYGIFINFDMEQYALKEITRDLFKILINQPEFKCYRFFGIVVQAYLKDAHNDVRDWIEFAKTRQTPFTIRLVKGAYWDYETIIAQQNGWPCPVFTHKFESDQNYEACTKLLLDAYPHIELALGSHNVRSIAHAIAYAKAKGLPSSAFEIQMLYGMADAFKTALSSQGFRVREYAPIGEMLPGLSYLVRRLLENSANDSFLKQSFLDQRAVSSLLNPP